MTIMDAFKVSGKGVAITGRIDSGTVHTGDSVCLTAANVGTKILTVDAIQIGQQTHASAKQGDTVGILVNGIDRRDISRGGGDKLSASCGAHSGAMVATQAAVHREVDEDVQSAPKDSNPRWKVDYTGEVKGSIQGEILTVMSISSSMTVVGAAMTPDGKGKAPESVRLTVRNAKSARPSASVRLTLADGTACSHDAASRKPSALKLLDSDQKTFHAELSGALRCAGGQKGRIEFTAVLRNQQ